MVAIVDTSVTTTKKQTVTELGIAIAASTPNFSVNRNAVNQNISTATPTKIQFTTEEWDTLSCFDPVTNYRFTPTLAGKYYFDCWIQWTGVVDSSSAYVSIYKNGAEVKRNLVLLKGTQAQGHGCTGSVDMNGTTDYVEFFVDHTMGLTATIDGAVISTRAAGYKVG